jgi:hypothetical protein
MGASRSWRVDEPPPLRPFRTLKVCCCLPFHSNNTNLWTDVSKLVKSFSFFCVFVEKSSRNWEESSSTSYRTRSQPMRRSNLMTCHKGIGIHWQMARPSWMTCRSPKKRKDEGGSESLKASRIHLLMSERTERKKWPQGNVSRHFSFLPKEEGRDMEFNETAAGSATLHHSLSLSLYNHVK